MNDAPTTPMKILVVEDEEVDVALMKRAFARTSIPRSITYVSDGEAALEHLHRSKPHELPDLIVLDINLPRKSGREALQDIKSDPDLQPIPIAMFTSSNWDQDVHDCYRMGANCYIVKPVDFDGFLRVIKVVEDFWLGTATLPRVVLTAG